MQGRRKVIQTGIQTKRFKAYLGILVKAEASLNHVQFACSL